MLYDKQKVRAACARALAQIKQDNLDHRNRKIVYYRKELKKIRDSFRRYLPWNWKYRKYFDLNDDSVAAYVITRWEYSVNRGFGWRREDSIRKILRLCEFDPSQNQIELSNNDILDSRIILE